MNRDLYGSTNPEVENEKVALENEDLEAKIELATWENENLRDLLARMQSENMMLKQQQQAPLTYSVQKNAGNGLERMRDSFIGSTPTAPSSRTLAWSSPPIEYTTSDWSSLLASFNPSMLSGLDESPQTTAAGGELSIDFGSGTSSDASAGFPFTTIGSNPAFFSLASTFDAGTPAHQGNRLAPSSNDHNFDFGPLAPWPTSNIQDTSFNDLFNGSYMPSNKSGDYNPFLSNTPESTPLPRHMESNPSSSSSASFAASPSDLLRIPVQDTDPHRSERLKSRNARQKDIEAEGPSPFAPSASLHTPSNLSAALKKTLDSNSTPIIMASGSKFPKTQRSDKNIEVLTAWRTATSNPNFPKIQRSDKNIEVLTAWRTITSNLKFKDADMNELCAEFTAKAKSDGTKMVLEPQAICHILETLSRK
ncbi:hypothetical protein F5887DRAFT_891517 [Amanita rubescens]|nr:hypothetical protein F5887DRAFT_891517 [Amanita rubescens]